MANLSYMTITGKAQGLISAGCSTRESIGNKFQSGHTDEIMVLACIHNINNPESTTSATHGPIIITKYLDKSTPLLAQALERREEIDCTIDLYWTNPAGGQEKYFSIAIKGGMISDRTFDIPHVILQSNVEPQEHLYIRYREINWTHHVAATSGYAFWGE